ncbi:hypothetical protein [Vibrio spartinae]|uniref:Uncharacterized protein n=1 Tax=Vibrio spartinae TaxID=1918945 RepID=A0A1N6M5F6_9VIBR|nr:hypothetical protein [Vibrio spartinae]SIO94683.1 hypothetical protein VSP9026_02412 [Vibrio spartinae]
MADLMAQTLSMLRRKALKAALRNINLHLFNNKASEQQVIEFVALRLEVTPGIILLWKVNGGVPTEYVQPFLNILNEHSVWTCYQIRPNKRVALIHLGSTR